MVHPLTYPTAETAPAIETAGGHQDPTSGTTPAEQTGRTAASENQPAATPQQTQTPTVDSPAQSLDAATEPTADNDEKPEPLPLDQVFSILKNQRRRHVLRILKATDEPEVSLSDLAEQIAAWENDKPIAQITSGERKRVYVGLYQCHLPKMDGMDVISFNKPRGLISLSSDVDVLYGYLDTVDEPEEPSWHAYPALLSAGAALVLTGALLAQSTTTMPLIESAVVLLIGSFSVYALVSFSRQREATDEQAMVAEEQ